MNFVLKTRNFVLQMTNFAGLPRPRPWHPGWPPDCFPHARLDDSSRSCVQSLRAGGLFVHCLFTVFHRFSLFFTVLQVETCEYTGCCTDNVPFLNRGYASSRFFEACGALDVRTAKMPKNDQKKSSFRSILGLLWVKTTSLSGYHSRLGTINGLVLCDPSFPGSKHVIADFSLVSHHFVTFSINFVTFSITSVTFSNSC